MKSPLGLRQILIAVLSLALAQLACSVGSRTSSAATQPPPPSSAPQNTQPAPAGASEHGTVEEAMAMLQKAVAHYISVGRTQALADFTGRVSPFFDRDLYVACIDSHLVQSANGGFPNLVGSKVEPLSRAAWDAASTKRVDSISYSYLNPINNVTEGKTFYYEKVGTDVCGVGVYHP